MNTAELSKKKISVKRNAPEDEDSNSDETKRVSNEEEIIESDVEPFRKRDYQHLVFRKNVCGFLRRLL